MHQYRLGKGEYVLGRVLRIGGDVVGVDRQYGQTLVHPLAGPLPEYRPNVDDERAVVADAHQQGRGTGHVGLAVQLSIRVEEPEVGQAGAEGLPMSQPNELYSADSGLIQAQQSAIGALSAAVSRGTSPEAARSGTPTLALISWAFVHGLVFLARDGALQAAVGTDDCVAKA